MYRNRFLLFVLIVICFSLKLGAQTTEGFKHIIFNKQVFQLYNVTGEVIKFQGKKVLKIERDLIAFPFDTSRLEATVDDIHYARLLDLNDFENGTIEIKMYSQIQNPSPFLGAAGFIGIYYRIQDDNSAFESIYLRPKVGRAANQLHRNHAVQYFAFPHAKFDTLRKIAPFKYEGSAPVALGEWITMRIEVNGETAEMFINDLKYSSFIVEKMLGTTKKGSIGLYVDIGTIGYFRDLKITKKAIKAKPKVAEKVNGI
jgi:Domain of Unknown Function (DUF1080)